MTEVETCEVFTRWFDALLAWHLEHAELICDCDLSDISQLSDRDVQASLDDALHNFIELNVSETHGVFVASLALPSSVARDRHWSIDEDAIMAAMAEIVPGAADHTMEHNESLSGWAIPYGQFDDTDNVNMSIYNASYIPVRYWPPYVQAPGDDNPKLPDETELIAYLTQQGLDIELLQKAISVFQSPVKRFRFLKWLGVLVSVVRFVLDTLRHQLAEPEFRSDEINRIVSIYRKRLKIPI